jgi:anti-sigma regulatory factor (Ser/Thr protein kinase)
MLEFVRLGKYMAMAEERFSSTVTMVLCEGCGDAVAAAGSCPTCGQSNPLAPATRGSELVDEGRLLDRVDVALAAQAQLANRIAGQRAVAQGQLVQEAVVLHGRLRRQRSLLRARISRQRRLVSKVDTSLHRVEDVLARTDSPACANRAWNIRARLPRDPSCATVARRLIEEYAREQFGEEEAEGALLIVSELATNAFLYGRGAIIMTVTRVGDRLRVEMRDEGHPDRIAVVREEERDWRGRGLWLVDQLSSEWGTTAGTGHVWAELALAIPRS